MRFLRKDESSTVPFVSAERRNELSRFEKDSQLRFRRLDLLNLAFSHRSFTNEDPHHSGNYERLEFLGDSVLGLVIAEYLFTTYPEKAEGELAKIKSVVVSEDSLAEIALTLQINRYLIIGKGEENSGGRTKKAILADVVEAVIGAWYLDQGLKETQRFILQNFVPEIEKVLANKHRKDYKTLLQEQVQKVLKTFPRYVMVDKTGPDHAKVFWIEVQIGSQHFGPADGHNKKEAEQKVACIAYETLFGTHSPE